MADNKQTETTGPNGFSLLNFINSNTQIVLFVLLVLICFIIFKDFIFFKKVWLFKDIGSDNTTLYYPLLAGFSDFVRAGEVPEWSFTQGMGQNIFPLWCADFFSNFLTFFDKSKIPYGIAYMEMVKITLSGLIFYRFLKEIKLSNYVCLLFALMYSFSGFMILGGTWIIYSIEALYVAIILYGFERWLNHKKYFWFVLGIMLLTFLQPFLLFVYTLFLTCYITARYFDLGLKGGKDFIIFLSKTVGLAVLGVALAAYQLLPDLLQMIESPRVGGESGLFGWLKGQPVFAFADEWLRFTTIYRTFGTDMLGNGTGFKGWQNYLEAPLFYCGILCLMIFPQFFISLTKKQKRIYGVITVLFVVPILFPYFRYLFWAFTGDYYRTYSLIITIFLLIFSARAFNFIVEKQKINKIALLITALFSLFLLYTPNPQFKSGVNETLRTLVTVLILGYGFLIYRMGSAKIISDGLKIIVLIACVTELLYTSYSTINNRVFIAHAELKGKLGFNDYTKDGVDYLKQIDKSFYRINKDYQSSPTQHASYNEGKVQGYYGTSSYHSFNQKNYIKFLGDFGVINVANEMETRWAKGLVERPILFTLANGKYWLTKRTDNAIASMGFDSIAKFGDVKVYKNKFSVPFGVTYNKIIKEEDFKKLSNLQKDFCALRACIVSGKDFDVFSYFKQFNLADTGMVLSYENLATYIKELKKDTLTITKFSDNHITGNVNVEESKILFFSFPFDEGWKAKLNNTDAKLYRVNAGLTGILLNKGANSVELAFKPRLKKEGSLISIASLFVFAGLLGMSKFRKKPSES